MTPESADIGWREVLQEFREMMAWALLWPAAPFLWMGYWILRLSMWFSPKAVDGVAAEALKKAERMTKRR